MRFSLKVGWLEVVQIHPPANAIFLIQIVIGANCTLVKVVDVAIADGCDVTQSVPWEGAVTPSSWTPPGGRLRGLYSCLHSKSDGLAAACDTVTLFPLFPAAVGVQI